MKTITFYSYKGGVGRSLALSQVAIRLSEYQKKVCVLDFDLEAPGLNFKFQNYDKKHPITKGIVDYISEFTNSGQIPKSIKEFSVRLNPRNQKYKYIDLIPAGDIEQDEYWQNLSKIDWTSLFYREQSVGVRFFLDLKARIKNELNPDFLLIDSRTGITDIAGITLRLLADEAVILAANNEENMFGSQKIIKSLIDPKRALFGNVPKIHFVLTRLPFTAEPIDRAKERNIVLKRRKQLLGHLQLEDMEISVIHSDRRLEENERHLMGYEFDEKDVSISNDYLKLFEKLTSDVLTLEETLKFRNFRKAEETFQRALAEKDLAKRLKLLDEAIELDSSNANYFFTRGEVYWTLAMEREAASDFEKVYRMNPNSAETLNYLGLVYKDTQPEKATKYYQKAIETGPYFYPSYLNLAVHYKKNGAPELGLKIIDEFIALFGLEHDFAPRALNDRADILRQLGDYEKAMKDVYKAIEMNPSEPVYLGTLAEIYADKGMNDEFFLNLSIALSKGINAESMQTANDVYAKFKDDERFLELLRRYDIDLNVILGEGKN